MRMLQPDLRPQLRPRVRIARTRLLAAVVALALSAVLSPAAHALENLDAFPRSALNIRTRQGPEWFSVWIADTPARSQQGLMFLRWLTADQGRVVPEGTPSGM